MNVLMLMAATVLIPPTITLPEGNAPAPVSFPHFPDRISAFVWRNWPLVPVERMAKVVGAQPADILRLGKEMGLPMTMHADGFHTRGRERRGVL